MDYQAARHNMVENQIRPNGVTDIHIISSMENIPREKFVPKNLEAVAYGDRAIFLGNERYLMAPMLFAQLLQEAKISLDHIVLNIGCGSGYSTAVLAGISKAVVGIEIDPLLAKKASKTMVELGIDNALIVEKKLTDGYAKQAPYDVIIFSGSIEKVPKKIIDQMGDGGRLVSVIMDETKSLGSMGKVVVATKFRGVVSETEVFDGTAPPLLEFKKERYFKF
jgi:protein-L-isoaspartate(D-aspartate) O-methyltransferase